MDEIAIELGETPRRLLPDLPEEKALREIMRRELTELKQRRKQNHG